MAEPIHTIRGRRNLGEGASLSGETQNLQRTGRDSGGWSGPTADAVNTHRGDGREHREYAEVLAMMVEHKEAIAETLRLLQSLHDRGILQTLSAAVEQSNEAVRIIVDEAAKPHNVASIQNAMIGMQMLSRLEPRHVQLLADGLCEGVRLVGKHVDEQQIATGVRWNWLTVLRLVRRPQWLRGLGIVVRFVEGLGKGTVPRIPTDDASRER